MKNTVDVPYQPERSVIIFGLKSEENETLDTTVAWLIEVLEVDVIVRTYKRATPRNDKGICVITVELETVEEKVQILRASANAKR